MITINELFSGIGAQVAALKRLGIEYETVGISEIDRFAIQSYEEINGKTILEVNSNIRSFLKELFGNIDEDAVKDSIKSVKEQVYKLQIELIELNSQLDVINILKKKNKIIHNEEN